MSYCIEKSVESERDIEEAFVYIAEDNVDKAVYFLVVVEDSIETYRTPVYRQRSAF